MTHNCRDSRKVSSCHTSGEDEVGLGLAPALHTLSRKDGRSSDPQSFPLSVGGPPQAWVGSICPATCSLTRLQILLLLQWAESKGELEGIKDSSGSWSHLPWIIHEPVASPPCWWSVLPHTESHQISSQSCQYRSSQKLPATAECHPCPQSLFSLISDMTASSTVPMIPKRFLSHTEPPRTRAIDAEGEGRTSVSSCISGLVKAREGTGWWKTQRQQGQQCCSQTARKAALEMLLQWETYNATRNSSVRPISFLSLMRYVAAELDSNKRNTSWFYEDFWHIPMYILINTWETVKVLCTAQRVTWPHSKSSHLWVCNLFCPFQDARQYFNVFIIS